VSRRSRKREGAPNLAPPAAEPSPTAVPIGGLQRRDPALTAAAVGAVLLLIAAYANHFHNEFHFDDAHVIENNLYIRSLGNVPLFFQDAYTFSSLPSNATYRPLLTLSYAVDYALGGGLKPFHFHLTQFTLHLLHGVVLFFLFLWCMDLAGRHPWNRWAALVAAALFSLHTANTETLNLLSSRSDLVSTLAVSLALLLFARYPSSRRFYLFLLPVVIGGLAKAPVVIFAPLLLAYLLLFREEERTATRQRRDARGISVYVVPSFAVAAGLLWFLNSMNAPEWTSGGGDSAAYVRTQAYVWAHYLRLFFVPVGLTADTDLRPMEWNDARIWLGLLVVGTLVAAIWASSRQKVNRPIAFGLTWFVLALIPTSVFPLAEVANEHRIYFPYVGLSLAVVWWVTLRLRNLRLRLPRATWAAVIAAVAVLAAHAIGAHERNKVWRTEESLWLDVTQKSPSNGRALMNYGLTQMRQGRYEVARSYFERAAVLNPAYSTLEINLGIVNGAMGQHERAESHFRRALELSSDLDSNFFYGRWLLQRGRGPEAVERLESAVRISRAAPAARELLMKVYAAIGSPRLPELAATTARIDPGNATARAFAGGRYPLGVRDDSYTGFFDAAQAALWREDFLHAALGYRAALQLQPSSADALNNLGWALTKLGFYPPAVTAYEGALAADPGYERARNNLQWVQSLIRQQPPS
jgi:protein O-mannosyl-transferase